MILYRPLAASLATRSLRLAAKLVMIVCVLTPIGHAIAQDALPQRRAMQEDAELCDVQFVDPERGWAVGDRGVIWHTEDGGRSWVLQPSGVTCRLSSVSFVDAENGWAVGGTTQGYTHTTRGVLLVTHDGGRSWRCDRTLVLPALRQVRFFDRANGWALGESSATFASGVFSTEDGGRSWTPMSTQTVEGWLCGDFVDPHTGALAGRRGVMAAVRRRGLESSKTPELGLRGLQKMRLTSSGGWLVGDGGLVLTTTDVGKNWTAPTGDPGAATGGEFDWRAVDVRAAKCWIAGAPGSRVLHTSDGGQSWQTFATGSHVPIRALAFVDDTQGWAVGALGTILHTSDGGRTWQRQHSGGTRAAILALIAEPLSAPLELFARLSGNDGYLSAVEFLNRRDLESPRPEDDTLDLRAQDALSLVGTSAAGTAWSFPLRQAGLTLSTQQILDGWNRANDGQATTQLEAHLIRQIRMWRPEVIVTHASSPRGNDPLGHLVNQFVLRAVEHAADATRLPEHLAQQDLEPWRVKKVLGLLADAQPGQLNITTSQLAPRLGASLAEVADEARSLLADEYTAALPTIGFQVAVDALPQGAGSHDFMSGLTLYPGGDARRKLTESPEQGVEAMRRVAQKHRNVQAILARSEHNSAERRGMTAQVGDLTMGLDDAGSGEVLFHMAHHYWKSGRWDAAAEMFQMLVSRYPQHRLAVPSMVWLVQYWSSGEVGWQMERAVRSSAVEAELPTVGLMPTPARTAAAAQQAAAHALRTKRTVGLVTDTPNETQRSERASNFGRQIEQQHAAVFAEPNVQFAWATAQRKAGLPGTGDRLFAMMTRGRSHDAWWSCAAGELWLAEPAKSTPPKSVWRVVGTAARPYLDGRLDEPMWQEAAPIELLSAL
ncbi:MAG TPA: YCF48-related protein, partial [Pirellulales bacterium]|nr:YCF48-related protein [Pirellulales bacterium]